MCKNGCENGCDNENELQYRNSWIIVSENQCPFCGSNTWLCIAADNAGGMGIARFGGVIVDDDNDPDDRVLMRFLSSSVWRSNSIDECLGCGAFVSGPVDVERCA